MAVSITDQFKIDKKLFADSGALDTILDIDSRYFLDPKLLDNITIPEFISSYKKIQQNFKEVFKLLKASKVEGDVFWRNAYTRFPQGELKGLNLGYSDGTDGSGFGPTHVTAVMQTAKAIADAGVEDPALFELVGVFEKGIGADRLSDLFCLIIKDDIRIYSERVFSDVGIDKSMQYRGKTLNVPQNPFKKEPVLLLPKELLRDLPIAYTWEDIDLVCQYNKALRDKVNSIIGNTWKRATDSKHKQTLKEMLIANPELATNFIDVYKNKPAKKYSFTDDPAGEIIWYESAKELVTKYPLDLGKKPTTYEQVKEVVIKIILHFKKLVEDNGQYELLYRDNNCKNHKPERAAQKLFFAIADAYCNANDIDLSPEVNSGRGSVDFKFSVGYEARIIVETKLSTSSALISGYESQIEEYRKAEKVKPNQCFYLGIEVTKSRQGRLQLVQKKQGEMISKGLETPELYWVNARVRPTASKVKSILSK